MKKLLALLLVLVMVFSLAACGKKTEDEGKKKEDTEETESTGETEETESTGEPEETEPEETEPEETEPEVVEPDEEVDGIYVMMSYTDAGETLSAEEILDAFGEAPELVLNGDGTGTLSLGGNVMDMEYDDSYIWPEGEEADKELYEINGNEVRIYDDQDNEMIFVKVAGNESGNEPAKVEDAYYCIGGLVDNEIYNAADLEMEGWYIVITGEGTAIAGDGVEEIEMGFDDETMWEAEDPDTTIKCEITEDSITWTYEDDGTQIFFEK